MAAIADLDVAIAAALAGAEIVRDRFGSVTHADFKGPVDPVTEVDRFAEEAILAVIKAHRPGDALLGEESGGESRAKGRRWIIDPLDGTVNFIHGIPHVAVSVALYDGATGLVGVVVDVLRDDLFSAEKGKGSYRNGERIWVTGRADIGACLLATGFPYNRQEKGREYSEAVAAALRIARGIRRIGTAALDLAWVACGRLDGYWEFNLAPWDMAAGIILVTEAGGRVGNEHGTDLELTDRLVLATNGAVHDQLADLIAPFIEPALR